MRESPDGTMYRFENLLVAFMALPTTTKDLLRFSRGHVPLFPREWPQFFDKRILGWLDRHRGDKVTLIPWIISTMPISTDTALAW